MWMNGLVCQNKMASMESNNFIPFDSWEASSAVLHFWSIEISAPAIKQPGFPDILTFIRIQKSQCKKKKCTWHQNSGMYICVFCNNVHDFFNFSHCINIKSIDFRVWRIKFDNCNSILNFILGVDMTITPSWCWKMAEWKLTYIAKLNKYKNKYTYTLTHEYTYNYL